MIPGELPDEVKLARWLADVDDRVACRERPIKRGLRSGPRPVAETAWRCEGRWQAEDQMDIWQCVDEAELDERRRRGEDQEDED